MQKKRLTILKKVKRFCIIK